MSANLIEGSAKRTHQPNAKLEFLSEISEIDKHAIAATEARAYRKIKNALPKSIAPFLYIFRVERGEQHDAERRRCFEKAIRSAIANPSGDAPELIVKVESGPPDSPQISLAPDREKRDDRLAPDFTPVEQPAVSPVEIAKHLRALAKHLEKHLDQTPIEPGKLMARLTPELREVLGTIVKLSGQDVSSFALYGDAAKIAGVDPTAVSYAIRTNRLKPYSLAGKRGVLAIPDVLELWPKNGSRRPGKAARK